jgi:hypothetical protein
MPAHAHLGVRLRGARPQRVNDGHVARARLAKQADIQRASVQPWRVGQEAIWQREKGERLAAQRRALLRLRAGAQRPRRRAAAGGRARGARARRLAVVGREAAERTHAAARQRQQHHAPPLAPRQQRLRTRHAVTRVVRARRRRGAAREAGALHERGRHAQRARQRVADSQQEQPQLPGAHARRRRHE